MSRGAGCIFPVSSPSSFTSENRALIWQRAEEEIRKQLAGGQATRPAGVPKVSVGVSIKSA